MAQQVTMKHKQKYIRKHASSCALVPEQNLYLGSENRSFSTTLFRCRADHDENRNFTREGGSRTPSSSHAYTPVGCQCIYNNYVML